jgi:CBS domain-containing protein
MDVKTSRPDQTSTKQVGKEQSITKEIIPHPTHSQPPNVGFKILQDNSFRDVLSTKEFYGREVISRKKNETLERALADMARGKILGIPVMSEADVCVGFVDVLDIAKFIITSSPDPNKITSKELDELVVSGKNLLQTPLGEIVNLSNKDPLVAYFESHPASTALEQFAAGIHRGVVFDDNPERATAADKKMTGVVTQSDFVRVLATWLDSGKVDVNEAKAMADKKLRDFGDLGVSMIFDAQQLPGVLRVHKDASVMQAILKLAMSGASALAITDPENGKLIANFSASDLRAIYHDEPKTRAFSLFLANVYNYLKDHSEHSLQPVTSSNADITFLQALKTMEEKRIHHIWIVNSENQPTGIVTQTDIMRVVQRWKQPGRFFAMPGPVPLSESQKQEQQQKQAQQQKQEQAGSKEDARESSSESQAQEAAKG